MRFLLAGLLALLLAAPIAANEVYRTVDERGVVHYSDRPLSARSERLNVKSAATDPERVAAESRELLAGNDEERAQRAAEQESLAAARSEQAELMADACRQAREAVAAYERAPRLYETLPDGGRRYLSDEEIVQARQKARQAVIDFCVE
jgi:hypothetical protein